MITSVDKYIPSGYERNDVLNSFVDVINQLNTVGRQEILGIMDILDPLKIPSRLLPEMGYYLNAGILQGDSDRQKRSKILYAIQGHKKRGSFLFDAKPKIDAVALGDSSILRVIGGDDWVLFGETTQPSGYFWSVLGGDILDDDYGIRLVGEGTENVVKGVIDIDSDNDSLTADQIERIRLSLLDVIPGYFRVFLGYRDALGNYARYGEIL